MRRLGLRCPADVSIVGFDDTHYARMMDPPLTTVLQPKKNLGQTAVDLLLLEAALRNFSARPYIACKLSEVIHPVAGAIRTDLPAHRDRLPPSAKTASCSAAIIHNRTASPGSGAELTQVVDLAKACFAGKSASARDTFFFHNSRHIYT